MRFADCCSGYIAADEASWRNNRRLRSISDVVIDKASLRVAIAIRLSAMLDLETCEDAMLSRDAAFDGLFFVGVKTTGIYCRPVCTARIPLKKNICFFPSAAAAERSGFRPCLRCRPETAPFCPAWNGTRTTVDRALKLIEAGALDTGSIEALAERLGVGTRHLSRLFGKHLDASPREVAKTLRVQRCKRLLDETDISIADIAKRAGFPSSRRMSAAFSALYGCPPSEMRRKKRTQKTASGKNAVRSETHERSKSAGARRSTATLE